MASFAASPSSREPHVGWQRIGRWCWLSFGGPGPRSGRFVRGSRVAVRPAGTCDAGGSGGVATRVGCPGGAAGSAAWPACGWPMARSRRFCGASVPRPVIVLPRALVERLDAAGRRALLAHELGHYYRRDHWMRWLEMLVLAACWWNPVAWWACRQLRIAEEQCCDAWAIWLLDGASRLYGRTLLETIEFLCHARRSRRSGASGIGQSGSRRKRFEMILEQPFVRRLSVSTWLAVVPLAIVVLSVSLCFSPVGGLWSARPCRPARASPRRRRQRRARREALRAGLDRRPAGRQDSGNGARTSRRVLGKAICRGPRRSHGSLGPPPGRDGETGGA